MPPSDLITSLVEDLTVYERNRPRSRQTETGASQVGHCRAEAVLRVRGEPESDPRLSWQAWVGLAIHERLDRIRGGDPRYLTETRLTYRGVPCTVDVIDLERRTVIDYKTKDAADHFPDECHPSWLRQVNLGAAAANEAGIDVAYVAIIVLPRAGEFEAQAFGPYPVDRSIADEAAEWVTETDRLARVPPEQLDLSKLRDQPPMWCRTWCPYVTACRGTPSPEQPLDASAASVAAEYDIARAARDKAKARMDDARDLLVGLTGEIDGWRINTTGGREKVEQVEDTDLIRDWWRFVEGEEPPTREVTTTTPIRLTVKRTP